jgi:hypothetical protein
MNCRYSLATAARATAALRGLHDETAWFRGFIIETGTRIVDAWAREAENRSVRIPEAF